MDNWLKYLVGAACAVVIVAGAIYIHGVYRGRAAAERRIAAEENAKKELFNLAQVKLGDVDGIKSYCSSIEGLTKTSEFSLNKDNVKDLADSVIHNCHHFGYL